jgi:N-acetylmuramic acid 6-phosphate etherase
MRQAEERRGSARRPAEAAVTARRRVSLAELEGLISEGRNPNSMEIDLQPTEAILRTINAEDRLVPAAVERELPAIARAVDSIVTAFGKGARLVYIGAGTSGRLGVLDAAECPPTFGVPPTMVVGLIAGGPAALTRAIEGAEDDAAAGAEALRGIGFTAADVLVGIAASGRTPYVIGALDYAKGLGATTIGLTCNPDSAIARRVDISIAPVVGPEVVTGSTRMKSGTAHKLVLNMLSTASMIRIGKVFQNLMVDLHPTNEKLLTRAARIVMAATGCDEPAAERALQASGRDVKLAVLMVATGLPAEAARTRLAAAGGFLRRAIADRSAQT